MDQIRFQLEMAAFDEKIALAELEESKAAERVKELKYERTRFQLEFLTIIARNQDAARQQAQQQIQSPPQQG
jgi:hypothetical protein